MEPNPQQPNLARQAASRLRTGDLQGARKLYLELIDRHPEPDHWLTLGQIHLGLDDFPAATENLQQAARSRPIKPELTARISDLQFELGQIEQSLETLRQAAGELPDNPRLQLLLAQALEDVGKRDEAMATYKKALDLSPGWSLALGGLLRVARENAEPDWVDQAGALLDDDKVATDDRAVLGYGLGRVHERRDEPEAAFEAWCKANHLRRRITGGLDHTAARAHIDAQIKRYSARALARPLELEHPDRTPVFIVGMPRSGTTLVEQMLSAHPDVAGYGELPTIARIAGQLEAAARRHRADSDRANPVSPVTRHLPASVAQQAVETYYRELERRRETKSPVTVDKAPLNFFHAGLISLLFPRARILVCQRDPRDVCLSIYAENFGLNQAFATDLDDLVCFYRQYRRLIEHWKHAIPDRLREIRYEDLVDAPEQQLKPLLSWIGLEWDPACLAFHQRPGAVLTPSKWQVRSPLYRSSIGRWKKYRDRIGPLLEAFGDEANSTD